MRKKWTTDEEKWLGLNYSSKSCDEIIKFLNRSWSSIEHRALRMGLKRRKDEWSLDDIRLLVSAYETANKKQLVELFPERTWLAIVRKAKSQGLLSRRQLRKSEVSVLLEDRIESNYWIGFLMADGHFDLNKSGRGDYVIDLTISIRDANHLSKYAKYINAAMRDSESRVRVRVCNRNVVKTLCERYDLKNQKTYFPPSISVFDQLQRDSFIALFIGFFDGDGCVTSKGTGRIQLHSNWLPVLKRWKEIIVDQLNVAMPDPKINNDGYADWFINSSILKRLKEEANKLKIPTLDRKWNMIS